MSVGRNTLVSAVILKVIRVKQFQSNDSLLRNLGTRSLPWNPLLGEVGEAIDVYCMVAGKDVDLLGFTLPSLQRISSNPIRQIYIVAPESLSIKIETVCRDLDISIKIMTDEGLLQKFGLGDITYTHGHPKMLILKYLCALQSDIDNVLVVDGDTIFLRPRQWLSKDKKLLVVAQELHQFHLDYCAHFFGVQSNRNLGFTTQSQLLSKSDLTSIAEAIGGVDKLARNFLQTYIDFHSGLNKLYFPAEWQLACEWALKSNPEGVVFGNYSNLAFSRSLFFELMRKNNYLSSNEISLDFLTETVPFLGSISLHDYK